MIAPSLGRRLAAGLVASVAAIVLVAGPAAAQTVPPIDVVGTNVADFPTVRLGIAVSGDAATEELEPADFQVTENGEAVEVTEATPVSAGSLDVVLAIDTSGSMEGDALTQAKVAALEFLDELPDNARVAIVDFGDGASLTSSFTEDRDATREAINGLEADGNTPLFDAAALSLQQLAASDADSSALVLLADGAESGSQSASLDDVTAGLEDTEAQFYAVSLETEDSDTQQLETLAEAADGSVVSATDPDALADAYVSLGQRIANQYVISFESVTEEAIATWEITVDGADGTASQQLALPGRSGGATPSDDAASPVVVEPLITEGDAGVLEQDWVLYVGALLVAAALAITAWVVAPSGEERQLRRSLRSDRPDSRSDIGTGERIVDSVRDGVTRVSNRAVERSEQGRSIDRALDRAGLVIRAGEFVAIVAGVTLVAALVLFLLLGLVGLVLGLVLPAVLAPTVLRFLAVRRNNKFAEQLPDTLLMMAGSLRSGFGIGQAIDQVAEEMDPPIADEFQRAVLETRLGRDVEDAMNSIALRVQNEDFEWVVDAMRIHHQVGGDLSKILDKVSQTIRARNKLKRQIRALTAEGRLSGIVLAALPVLMGLFLYSSNPEYMDPLFEETAGLIMFGGGIVLLIAGGLWLKKLIDVEL